MPVPKGFKRVRKIIKNPKRTCAKGSYGLTPERKGTRVLVCCARGQYNKRTGKCRAATKAVEIFKRKGRA